ncbi:MAG: PqqD family protein, partial [Bacteroidaceae bacterium]|nr:PqqD family protein [Bacteroidaceae bacterium]
VDMTRIISLNESACLLYQALAEREFSTEDAARVLTETYGISDGQALTDAAKWVEALKGCGVIE